MGVYKTINYFELICPILQPDYKEIKYKRLEGFHKVTKARGKIAARVSEDTKKKTKEEQEHPRRLKREVRSLEDLTPAYLVSEFKEAEPRKRESSRCVF